MYHIREYFYLYVYRGGNLGGCFHKNLCCTLRKQIFSLNMPRNDSLASFSVTIFSCITKKYEAFHLHTSGDCYSGFSFHKISYLIFKIMTSLTGTAPEIKAAYFTKFFRANFLNDAFWMYIARDTFLGHLSMQILCYTLHKQFYLSVPTDGNSSCHSGKIRWCIFHKYVFNLLVAGDAIDHRSINIFFLSYF